MDLEFRFVLPLVRYNALRVMMGKVKRAVISERPRIQGYPFTVKLVCEELTGGNYYYLHFKDGEAFDIIIGYLKDGILHKG